YACCRETADDNRRSLLVCVPVRCRFRRQTSEISAVGERPWPPVAGNGLGWPEMASVGRGFQQMQLTALPNRLMQRHTLYTFHLPFRYRFFTLLVRQR